MNAFIRFLIKFDTFSKENKKYLTSKAVWLGGQREIRIFHDIKKLIIINFIIFVK